MYNKTYYGRVNDLSTVKVYEDCSLQFLTLLLKNYLHSVGRTFDPACYVASSRTFCNTVFTEIISRQFFQMNIQQGTKYHSRVPLYIVLSVFTCKSTSNLVKT